MVNRNTFILFVILVLIIHFLRGLEFSYYPDSAKKILSVKIEMEGAGALEMENQICNPLEEEIFTLHGISSINSRSDWEECEIIIFLEDSSDLNKFYIELRDVIDRKSQLFPPAAGKAVIRKSSSINTPVFIFVPELAASRSAHGEYPSWTEDTIRSVLNGISGMSQVHVSSSSEQDLNIRFDEERLRSIQLNSMDLAGTVYNQNKISRFNLNDSSNIIFDQRLESVADFNTMKLAGALPLSELADININNSDSKSESRLNGQRQSIVWIYENGDANSIELCRKLRKAVESLPEHLILYDKGKLIEDALKELFIILCLSVTSVILITVLLLKDIKSAVPVCLNIPFSIAGTLAVLNMLSMEINILVLSSLALCSGMIIDNGIIVLDQGFEKSKTALTSSLLSTLIVLTPFLFASSSLKILCLPLIMSLSICLSLSLLFIMLTMKDNTGRLTVRITRESPAIIENSSLILERLRVPGYMILILLVAASLLLFKNLEYTENFELINNSIGFSVEYPAGSRKELIEKQLAGLESSIQALEGIDYYSSEYQDEKAEFNIKITENSARDTVKNKIKETMQSLPGYLFFDTQTAGKSYEIKVISHNRALLYSETEALAEILQSKVFPQQLTLHYKKQPPVLRVRTNNRLCMMTQITPMAVSQAVSHSLSPPVLGKWIPGDGSVYDIRIYNKDIKNLDRSDLETLNINGNSNFKLEDLTYFEDSEDFGPIEHFNSQRYASFSISSEGLKTSQIHKIVEASLNEYRLPEGVRVVYGEKYRLHNENTSELIKLMAASILLLFFLLVFIFESAFLPVFMIAQIILCHVFTLAFLSLAKVDLSVPVFFALILNTGLSINNGLIVYSKFKSDKPFLAEALLSLYLCRNTILTAALTTLAGFLPFLTAGESSAELLKALSLTVGSSVIISILLLYCSLIFISPDHGTAENSTKTVK